jgi:DNA polymerase-3 subunit alpha
LDAISKLINPKFHPYKLPLNDIETYNFFATGDLSKIFQCTSEIFKEVSQDFKPSSIRELTILNALCRPKSMDFIPTLDNNKKYGYEHFLNEELDLLFNETFGLLIYQETFMHIVHKFSRMSYGEADIYRKILLKNEDKQKTKEFEEKFVHGCKINSSLSKTEILQLSKLIIISMPFSFLKSHSLSYAIISYWCAFYKTHFAKEYDQIFH